MKHTAQNSRFSPPEILMTKSPKPLPWLCLYQPFQDCCPIEPPYQTFPLSCAQWPLKWWRPCVSSKHQFGWFFISFRKHNQCLVLFIPLAPVIFRLVTLPLGACRLDVTWLFTIPQFRTDLARVALGLVLSSILLSSEHLVLARLPHELWSMLWVNFLNNDDGTRWHMWSSHASSAERADPNGNFNRSPELSTNIVTQRPSSMKAFVESSSALSCYELAKYYFIAWQVYCVRAKVESSAILLNAFLAQYRLRRNFYMRRGSSWCAMTHANRTSLSHLEITVHATFRAYSSSMNFSLVVFVRLDSLWCDTKELFASSPHRILQTCFAFKIACTCADQDGNFSCCPLELGVKSLIRTHGRRNYNLQMVSLLRATGAIASYKT